MTMQDLLLDAVEQRVLRQLDVQFAMMIAADQPAVMLAAALLSKDAGEGHVCLPPRVWWLTRKCRLSSSPPLRCWGEGGLAENLAGIVSRWAGRQPAPLILTGSAYT